MTRAAITSMISDGVRPNRPQEAEKLGLTDSLWEMTCRCWHQDPARRPNITEVAAFLREWSASSFFMETSLRYFFEVCKTQGKDGRREKAQEFVDEFDKVRHAERRNVNSSHHKSRNLTTQTFPGKNGINICGTCEGCVVVLTFFHPRSCSHKSPSNRRLLPLTQVVSRLCTRQPSRMASLR